MKLTELENPETAYRDERLAAKSLAELKAVLERWRSLAFDGWEVAQRMTESDYAEYQSGVELEAKDIYGGDEWYQKYKAICFPEVLFRVSMMSVESHAPWRQCYEALVDGYVILEDENGISQFAK